MVTNQVNSILSQVQQLPAHEQLQIIQRVAQWLERANQPASDTAQPINGAAPVRPASLRDFSADRQWLAEHRDEYAGQWVALDNGQLVSHGPHAKEVHQTAQAAGHPEALLVLVEPSDAPPFIL